MPRFLAGKLWLLGWLFLTPVGAQEGLSLDGMVLGMTYAEVLQVKGRPAALGHKEGLWSMVYPAPARRPQPTSVWFHRGRAVYIEGYTLERQGEPLFLYGLEAEVLRQEFGEPEVLNALALWWPSCGLVLAGGNRLGRDQPLSAPLGWRDPDFPLVWVEEDGLRVSRREPWADDRREEWLADDVALGMSESRARQLAGGLEIVYRAGYVQAVRCPPSAFLWRQSVSSDRSLSFEVGEEPVGLGPLGGIPADGWYSPVPGGRVLLAGGKVVQIELEWDNDELFQALEGWSGTP